MKIRLKMRRSLKLLRKTRKRMVLVKNVKMIVEKYNGTFKSEVQNKEFYVCVEMDMKTKINLHNFIC